MSFRKVVRLGKDDLGVNGAVVAAGQVVDAEVDETEATVGENVVDRDQRRQRRSPMVGKVGSRPLPVARPRRVAAIDHVAELRVVQGPVEVAGKHPGSTPPGFGRLSSALRQRCTSTVRRVGMDADHGPGAPSGIRQHGSRHAKAEARVVRRGVSGRRE